ncbi:ABC transporter permease subunit [Sulfitobacter sp. BDSS02]|uniref:ABC transporter permease n=1 Tax=Heliomarina TaxID=2917553 RepID=UPI001EE2DF68|nr:ABC transporter permease [Heliomarina baculiformis]MBL3702904.1 ABC transporter permease subunit [Sulfitobacter sp. BDSS02]MBR9849816.1 ABC transporter permease [Paracoccaceae bacterium]
MSDMALNTPPEPGALELEEARQDNRSRWLLALPALLIIGCFATLPLLVMLVYAFLTPGDYGNVVWKFSTDGWVAVLLQRDIFDDTLMWADAHLSIFWRSLRLSLITTVLTLVFGVPTAWFIATRPREKRQFWLFLVTVPFWTNLLVRTIAIQELIRSEGVINLILLKIGIIDEPIQMMFTDFAIGFGMTYVYLPLMVLPVYAAVDKLDFRLVEAAHDLYAGRWTAFRRVILPLIKPGIIAGSILVFIPCLGAYVTPRVLGGGKNLMFGNLIELQFGAGRNWPLGAALSLTLMAIVMVALIYYVRVTSREREDV